MHGGAQGSGAPSGNQNALKSGYFTREKKVERRRLFAQLRQSRRLLAEID